LAKIYKDIYTDILIVGAGILGCSLAYELSLVSPSSVLVVDLAPSPGFHTSSRNTGVIHRPFYLDPRSRGFFAKAAQNSYAMWQNLSLKYRLPWNQVGTLELGDDDRGSEAVEKFSKWAAENGMTEDEFAILNDKDISALEPEVKAPSAFYSKTDTSVNFGIFTSKMKELSEAGNVKYLFETKVLEVQETPEGMIALCSSRSGNLRIRCNTVVNAAGPESIAIAKSLGLAAGLAVLYFRGDYWKVNSDIGPRIKRNIYTVPRHSKYPFLDPHFIVKWNEEREIGPNAVLVGGPFSYRGFLKDSLKLFSPSVYPKVRLLANSEFLELVVSEWRTSIFKSAMAERLKRFIPSLEGSMLGGRGISGIRGSLIDSKGFVPEALILKSVHSIHILNYNSPGATGAPFFAIEIIRQMADYGLKLSNVVKEGDWIWKDTVKNHLSI